MANNGIKYALFRMKDRDSTYIYTTNMQEEIPVNCTSQ